MPRCGTDVSDSPPKKRKELLEESQCDATLFQLLGINSHDSNNSLASFTNHLEEQSEDIKVNIYIFYFTIVLIKALSGIWKMCRFFSVAQNVC